MQNFEFLRIFVSRPPGNKGLTMRGHGTQGSRPLWLITKMRLWVAKSGSSFLMSRIGKSKSSSISPLSYTCALSTSKLQPAEPPTAFPGSNPIKAHQIPSQIPYINTNSHTAHSFHIPNSSSAQYGISYNSCIHFPSSSPNSPSSILTIHPSQTPSTSISSFIVPSSHSFLHF